VESLAALSPADQETLRQLDVVDSILFYDDSGIYVQLDSSEPVDYPAEIARALAFYRALTLDEQVVARAIGLGGIFATYAPDAVVGEGGITALAHIRQLTQFYLANPSLQQAT
jgi:hypothetical protein